MMDLSMFSIYSYQSPGYILVFHSGIDISSSEKPIPIVTYTDSHFAKCYTSEALTPILQSYIQLLKLYMVPEYCSKDLALCASPIPMLSGQTLPGRNVVESVIYQCPSRVQKAASFTAGWLAQHLIWISHLTHICWGDLNVVYQPCKHKLFGSNTYIRDPGWMCRLLQKPS